MEKINQEVVTIESVVVVKLMMGDEEQQMTLKVVTDKPNFKSEIKEVSIKSPVGKAIFGKKVTDEISYELDGKTFKVEVLEIVSMEENMTDSEKSLEFKRQ